MKKLEEGPECQQAKLESMKQPTRNQPPNLRKLVAHLLKVQRSTDFLYPTHVVQMYLLGLREDYWWTLIKDSPPIDLEEVVSKART